MGKIYSKNSIISFVLILSIVLMPFSLLPKKTQAFGLDGYAKGLAGVIMRLPLCQGKKKVAAAAALTGTSAEVSDATSSAVEDSKTLLAEEIAAAKGEAMAVPTHDEDSGKSNAETASASKKTADKMRSLEENDTCLKSIGRVITKMLLQKITLSTVEWINGGIDGAPKFITNQDDFWLKLAENEVLGIGAEINDPSKYPFGKAFMRAQAQSFRSKFANNAQYTLNEMIQATNPEYNATTFTNDFEKGGWSAWLAMTQEAQNNPLGFMLKTSNELASRIENKTNLTKGSLQASGGYLGVEKCLDPTDVTKQEDMKGRRQGFTNNNRVIQYDGKSTNRVCTGGWQTVTPGGIVADAALKVTHYPDNNILRAEDLNDAVASILDAVLNKLSTTYLTDGFLGISDTSEFQSGLEGDFVMNYENMSNYGSYQVSNDFPDYLINGSSFLSQNPNFNIRTDFSQAIIDEQRIFRDKLIEQNKNIQSTVPADWSEPELRNNPPAGGIYRVNESTGNGRGDKAIDHVNGGGTFYTHNAGIIPIIYQLDYCIPGPHPGFEQDSRAVLNGVLSTFRPLTEGSAEAMEDDQFSEVLSGAVQLAGAVGGALIGAAIGSTLPVLGTIVGAIVGYAAGFIAEKLFSGNAEENVRSYYTSLYTMITGGKIVPVNNEGQAIRTPALHSLGPFSNAMNLILTRYIEIIYDLYPNTDEVKTSVWREAAEKYKEIKGYVLMSEKNEERSAKMESIIKRLTEIKKNIDTLNTQLAEGTIKDPVTNEIAQDQVSQYEKYLKPWTASFGTLSQEMVTGDDIALVDNMTKQIKDEASYIYNNLLKGPNGCEKQLEDGRAYPGYWQVSSKRPIYPGPILYDYNKYIATAGDIPSGDYNHPANMRDWLYPDPFSPTGKRRDYKMKQTGDVNTSLQYGFGLNVPLEDSNAYCGAIDGRGQAMNKTMLSHWSHTPLCINDIFPLRDWPAFAGPVFDLMIGLY